MSTCATQVLLFTGIFVVNYTNFLKENWPKSFLSFLFQRVASHDLHYVAIVLCQVMWLQGVVPWQSETDAGCTARSGRCPLHAEQYHNAPAVSGPFIIIRLYSSSNVADIYILKTLKSLPPVERSYSPCYNAISESPGTQLLYHYPLLLYSDVKRWPG